MRRIIGLGLVFAIGVLGLAASACGGGGEAVTPTVAPTVTPSATSTAAPAAPTAPPTSGGDLAKGKAAFVGTCGACHKVEGASQGALGPDLTHIGTVAATRKPGTGAEAYIRESIKTPGAFVTQGYSNLMPPGLDGALGADYEALVAYLLSLK